MELAWLQLLGSLSKNYYSTKIHAFLLNQFILVVSRKEYFTNEISKALYNN